MTRKVRVGLLFGGRSGEHEVSLASATAVLRALDRDRYEAVGIGITRHGKWLMSSRPENLLTGEVTSELPDTIEVAPDFSERTMTPVHNSQRTIVRDTGVDVVIPLLHGPYGEDGTVQGFLEMANMPYVGSGVLASAVGMDKVVMKNLFAQAGIPQVPYCLVRRRRWERAPDEVTRELAMTLSYPMFVKPCNLGSSLGISKVRHAEELVPAVDLAVRYDSRIIVEQGIEAREVECGVMGNHEPLVSIPGEIVSHREFYDYAAKYTDGEADLIIPARLTPDQTGATRDLALRAYEAIDASGLARVDFFVRDADGAVLVNEINTMPGFTATSMYPRLWEASGVTFSHLLDRLIGFAFERHEQRERASSER